jgi:hypothetical protein
MKLAENAVTELMLELEHTTFYHTSTYYCAWKPVVKILDLAMKFQWYVVQGI